MDNYKLRFRSLPGLACAHDGCAGDDLENGAAHYDSLRGTDGEHELIPLLGDMQGQTLEDLIHLPRPVFARLVSTSEARRMLGFAACLAVLALGLVVVFLASGIRLGPPLAIFALGGLAYVAEKQDVRLNSRTWVSVSFLPFVFAAVAFGPLAAMAVGALGLLAEVRRTLRWAVWTPSRVLVGAASGSAALGAMALVPDSFARLLLGAAAASIVEVIVDVGIGGATAAIRTGSPFWAIVRAHGPPSLWALPLYAPVIAILTYAYNEFSPMSVALFLGPAFVAQRLFALYREEREASAELERANLRLAKASLSFATALVATLDARDRYTAGHSAAVAIYARDIALRMGLSSEEQELAHLCGLVHDIGKIGLPPGLLEKVGPITLAERRQMETHSEIGERILAKVEDYAEIAEIVRHHHERWDGFGYPDGLAEAAIPLISRIIAVADAYNAMTSDRPYRDAMPSRIARLRLAQAADSQFDTAVVAAFEAILSGADESYRLGQRHDFRFEVQEVGSVGVVSV